MTMAEAKRQQVEALLHTGLAVADICCTMGVSERLIFKIKMLINNGKDLKIIRTGGPKANALSPPSDVSLPKYGEIREILFGSLPLNTTWR